jgi:hypothetical protein
MAGGSAWPCRCYGLVRAPHTRAPSLSLACRAPARRLQVFFLKMINAIVVYIVQRYQRANGFAQSTLSPTAIESLACAPDTPAGGATDAARRCSCPLLAMGWTFFWLVVADFAFSNIVEPGFGLLRHRIGHACAARRQLSDYDVKLDFDLADVSRRACTSSPSLAPDLARPLHLVLAPWWLDPAASSCLPRRWHAGTHVMRHACGVTQPSCCHAGHQAW